MPFAVQPDLGNEWGLSADDQRHRAVFNAFNRPNWGVNTQESSANFNRRTSAQFRTAQLGFRVTC